MPVTVWKGALSFGLVSIPIRIVRAARQEKIRFRQVYRPSAQAPVNIEDDEESSPGGEVNAELNAGVHHRAYPAVAASISPVGARESNPPPAPEVLPVHRAFAAGGSLNQPVAPEQVLKAVEIGKDRYAVFEQREISRFKVETSRAMEILEFVKLAEIDPAYFNASYYVIPDTGGEKAYALLFDAMGRSGLVAVGRVAMHGRQQVLTLRSGKHGIVMHTLFFQPEVHEADEFHADTSLVKPQEAKLADLLVAQLATAFDPSQFKDERLEGMKAAIAAKAGAAMAAGQDLPAKPAAPVVDILEALKASLQRKPAASERAPRKRKAGSA